MGKVKKLNLEKEKIYSHLTLKRKLAKNLEEDMRTVEDYCCEICDNDMLPQDIKEDLLRRLLEYQEAVKLEYMLGVEEPSEALLKKAEKLEEDIEYAMCETENILDTLNTLSYRSASDVSALRDASDQLKQSTQNLEKLRGSNRTAMHSCMEELKRYREILINGKNMNGE